MQGRDRRAPALLAAAAVGLLVLAAGFLARFHDGADRRVVRSVHHWALAHGWAVSAGRGISTVAEPITWELLAVAAALWCWWRHRRLAALRLLAGLAGAQVLSSVTKLVVARPRPVLTHAVAHATGYSFPSGHALVSAGAVLVGLTVVRPRLAPLAFRWLTAAGVLVVVAVGLSRIVLGVHYPSDVLGGWALAGTWIFVVARVIAPDPAPDDAAVAARSGPAGLRPRRPSRWRR